METILIYLILLAVTAWVLWPLYRRTAPLAIPGTAAAGVTAGDEWMYQKRIAQDILADLQFDLQTGKLDEADHRLLTERQQKIIADMDEKIRRTRQSGGDEISRRLIAEIDRARAALAPAGDGRCRQCGAPPAAGARFCSQCGARVDG